MPRIPLIEDLTRGPVPAGSALFVEYDASSLWNNALCTIVAGWIKTGGKLEYYSHSRPLDDVRAQLMPLGLDVEFLEKQDALRLIDVYTCQLGQKSKEKYSYDSLKVADISIQYARDFMKLGPAPEVLVVSDSFSTIARFNEEKPWVEHTLTRTIPGRRSAKMTSIRGIMNGVHSEYAYRQLEAAGDGIIDFKLHDNGEEIRNMMRIRGMRNVHFDSRWHVLKVGENFEITLENQPINARA